MYYESLADKEQAFQRAVELIEWIEYYLINGVEYFTIYVYEIEHVLEYYQQCGMLEVIL